jgi:hypothetical protein
METIEYRTVDKSSWPRGPWDHEPDKKQWQDPTTGLPCLIVRGPVGALCGYVGVPPGHRFYQVDHDSVDVESPHGGLTFDGFCQHMPDESIGVCHRPAPGEPDAIWWLGFDCAHSGDLCPSYEARIDLDYPRIYRDLEYVTREVTELAARLA